MRISFLLVARPTYENLGNRPMLVFRATPDLSWALMVKNVVDWIGAAVGLVVLSPCFSSSALAIKLSSRGASHLFPAPGGIHGKPFTMLKFRTMLVDAEESRQAELMAKNEMSGPVFKVDNDPASHRSAVGSERTSLDELPQLVNVFLGDMSLVGPPPAALRGAQIFKAPHRRRLSMKPGLTCLWRIRGRKTT